MAQNTLPFGDSRTLNRASLTEGDTVQNVGHLGDHPANDARNSYPDIVVLDDIALPQQVKTAHRTIGLNPVNPAGYPSGAMGGWADPRFSCEGDSNAVGVQMPLNPTVQKTYEYGANVNDNAPGPNRYNETSGANVIIVPSLLETREDRAINRNQGVGSDQTLADDTSR